MNARLVACAGLIVAPLAWAIASELGLILPDAECATRFRPLLIATVLLTVLSGASGVVSWRAPWPGHTGRFASQLFALLAASMSYALILDIVASAVLTGCER